MTKKERFLAALERRPVDRLPWWLGLPTPQALENLYSYFGVGDFRSLKQALQDDVWTVELPYNSPYSRAIYDAFDFEKKDPSREHRERTLTSPGFFEDYEDAGAVDLFDWPEPSLYISERDCARAVETVPDGYPVMAVVWSAHFQDACAAFGMEDALVKMKLCPDLFQAVIDRVVDFYLKANGIFYRAAAGKIDAVLIGNDFGTQTGLIASADDLRRFVFPGTKRLVQQAHEYGIKVVHHSCGAIRDVIEDLIALGVDAIHPIQALAAGMEPAGLKERFGHQVSFCGGIDAQYLLTKGGPDDVRRAIGHIQSLFKTGMIVSPSHEAILPDIPPQNIEAFSRCFRGA